MKPNKLEKQPCPMCRKNTLTLIEDGVEIPFFGKAFIFSMDCSSCNYHKADVEAAEQKEPSKYELEVTSEKDMHIRIVKSSTATIKIPHIASVTPGPSSNGYVTNVEGIFNRIKVQTEHLRDEAEEKEDRKKAKNRLKKIMNIMGGRDKAKLIVEDPNGNSAIISDKAKKSSLKVKK